MEVILKEDLLFQHIVLHLNFSEEILVSLCVNSVGPKPIHEESCTVVGNDVNLYCSQSGCTIWNPNGTPNDRTNVCIVYSSYAGCFGKPNVESNPVYSGHNCYGKSAFTCQNSENSQCCEYY